MSDLPGLSPDPKQARGVVTRETVKCSVETYPGILKDYQ